MRISRKKFRTFFEIFVSRPTSVPHTWVLANRVNQRSHVTKVTEVKENVTQFIGGNLITIPTQYPIRVLYLRQQPASTLKFMGASSDLFDCYPWIFNTGNCLPRETSVTPLNAVSRG